MSALTAAESFPSPSLEYAQLAPIIIVLAAAVVGILVEAFAPRRLRFPLQLGVTFGGLGLAAVALLAAGTDDAIIGQGSIAFDGPARFLMGTILLLSIVALLLFTDRSVDPGRDPFAPAASALPGSEQERVLTERGVQQTEVYPLAMFSVGGMLLFPASNDLLMMFIALEVLSFPLYLLAGMARRRRLLSQEAALKYFLLGAYSSAFFLFGSALVYGYSGSLEFADIANSLGSSTQSDALLIGGIALIAVGLLFKIGAAPFHQWTPDVYQGAPTVVTGFMAACTKVAAFGALLRIFYVAFGGVRFDWRPMMYVIAILTMFVGVLFALTQTDVKRMLAYSSIAHAGFILTGVVALSEAGTSAVLFYLLTYGFATIGAFGIVTLVRDGAGEATHLSQWRGLGKRSPVVASMFALFLLALAGIPLTSGFTGKFAVFSAAAEGGASIVVIAGVLASAIAAFFYVRVIVLMFFNEPAEDGPSVAVPSIATSASLAFCVGLTIVLGVLPQLGLDLADRASIFVR
jgi:NADH-quinone oxidoreductase subunit N